MFRALEKLKYFDCVCMCFTWNHTMQALDMILGHSALCAHFVNETRDESPHRVGNVTGLRVFESTLSVKALGHTPCNTVYYMTLIILQTSTQHIQKQQWHSQYS